MTHQIAAAWRWWELQCETEIIPSRWGRQRWGERSPTRHRTVTGKREKPQQCVNAIKMHCDYHWKRNMLNVESILLLSSPSSCGGHIYLLALWKENCRRSQSGDRPGQSASATDDGNEINTLAVEASMKMSKLKRTQTLMGSHFSKRRVNVKEEGPVDVVASHLPKVCLIPAETHQWLTRQCNSNKFRG